MYYRMKVAGLDRDLPICPVNDKLYIAGFVIFGDQELTVACAKELLAKGQKAKYETVLKEIVQRDYQDTHREIAPLKQAEDAVLLDTTEMNLEEVVEAVCRLIDEARAVK